MLQVIGNAELRKARARSFRQRNLLPARMILWVLGLAGHLRHCWDAAKRSKKPLETVMLKALRQRNGEYEADKLQQIHQQGGSDIYMMITEVKCRAAESWLRDILLDQGTPPWDLQPTPIPDLSPDQTAELQNVFAAEVVKMIEQHQKAPTPDDIAEMKEMLTQDYRFKLLARCR